MMTTFNQTYRTCLPALLAALLLSGCVDPQSAQRQNSTKQGSTTSAADKQVDGESGPPKQSVSKQADNQPAGSQQGAEASQLPSPGDLTVRWEHDENIPGPADAPSSYHFIVNSGNKARFILTNQSNTPLPTTGWAIYFSSGKFSLEMVPEYFAANNPTLKLTFTGISGRYKVEPGEGFQPLEPGKSLTIAYRGTRFLMLKSDRPAGFYLVAADSTGREKVLGDIAIEYGPMQDFDPLPQPVGAQMTTARRYEHYARKVATAEPQLIVPRPKQITLDKEQQIFITALGPMEFPEELKFEGELVKKVLSGIERDKFLAHKVSLSIDENLPREEYRLIVDEEIKITGGSAAGLFYGVQTLTQLIERHKEENSLSHLTIEDRPGFGYRGLMVDICRHFYGPETLHKVIDQMAHYKLNVLQLHLNDDEGWRIEIEALPELAQIGSRRGHAIHDAEGKVQMLPMVYDDGAEGRAGYLSRDEYIALLKYAQQRHIEVIPEIDVPGHSRSAIQALKDKPGYLLTDPEDRSEHISPQGFTDNILNPAMEGVYPFIEEVFRGLNEMHEAAGVPLTRVHIGGDETPTEAWTLSPACAAKGYENVDPKENKEQADAVHKQIRMDFSKKLYEIIDRAVSDKVQIGCWHDNVPYILDRMAAGRAYMTDWDIEGEAGYARIRAGQPTVLCNPRYTYYDMAYEMHPSERGHFWSGATDTKKVFEYRPFALTDNPLKKEERDNILGMQAQIWTETVTSSELFESYLMPRLLAFFERAWNPDVSAEDVEQNWPAFAAYVGSVALPQLEESGFRFHLPKPGAISEEEKVKALVPFAGLEIRYTTDGSDPDASSPLYDPKQPPDHNAAMKLRTFTKTGQASATVALD